MSDQEEVRKLADLRQWLEDRIKELEEEISLNKQMMGLVDEQLKRESFVKAAEVPVTPREEPKEEAQEEAVVAEVSETRPLRRQRDNYLIANAYVQGDTVTIVPVSDVVLRATTPPFKSYLVGKVLEGMKQADADAVAKGKLQKGKEFSFEYKEEGGRITKLVLTNYNDKARLNEALNTTLWTFTKMLEKQA
ncbi:MAG TPA: hypothetical protein VMS77_02740 [Conexivisphaerales archaeon]|nr:hypothetical protein [Conexivisphaerales archaeon]